MAVPSDFIWQDIALGRLNIDGPSHLAHNWLTPENLRLKADILAQQHR